MGFYDVKIDNLAAIWYDKFRDILEMRQLHGATGNSESGSKKVYTGDGGKSSGAAPVRKLRLCAHRRGGRVTRQTISSIENQSRELSWTNFLSLLFLFLQNAQTAKLLPVMGIYTDELARIFSFTDLNQFRQ